MACKKCEKCNCAKRKKPAKFLTVPPFPKGSDQEKMKNWEMKGPDDNPSDSLSKENFGVATLIGRKWGSPIPLKS